MADASLWDWPGFLAGLGRFGIQLSLNRMEDLLRRLDHPQRGIPAIHVAGTNGKGSVCALLSHALMAAGYRVGRYTSPHLVSWRERIWINGSYIAETDWRRILKRLADLLETCTDIGESPTQFEVVTAAAWLYFQQQQVDCVVLEVGLGGRLDATTVGINAVLTLITSIGMDHWQRLGPTLAAIAYEKAGICKPGIPLICAPQDPSVLEVIQTCAAAQQAPMQVVTLADEPQSGILRWHGEDYPIALRGPSQRINGSVALAALDQLRHHGWILPIAAIQQGFKETIWPGRLQSVDYCGYPLLIDGAHNLPAAAVLREFVSATSRGSVTWFIGILSTKDVEGILATLLYPEDRFYALPVPGHSGSSPATLVEIARRIQPQLQVAHPLETLQEWSSLWQSTVGPDPSLKVLCGSLYLVGQVLNECFDLNIA